MSACKQCGLPISWRQEDGRWQCFNPDGSVHWDKCSEARFQRIKRTGEHFATADADGYKTPLKKSGVQFTMQRAKVRPNKVKVLDCPHDIPPWEVCDKCPAEAFIDRKLISSGG